jgi:hypothetical protein
MPFKSEAQRKYLWANEPEIARDWTDTYGSRIQKAGGQLVQPGPGRPGYQGDRPPGVTGQQTGGGYSDRERGQQQARTSHHPRADTGGYTPTHVRSGIAPPKQPERDGIIQGIKNFPDTMNRRGLRRNLDYYMGGKKLDWPLLAGIFKGPQEKENYYTEFAGLSPIEMQQRYEGTLSQADMDRVQHMSSVLGQDKINRKDFEEAFYGPKGPPQPDTGGGGEGGGQIPWWLRQQAPVTSTEEPTASTDPSDLYAGSYRLDPRFALAAEGGMIGSVGGTSRQKYQGGEIVGEGIDLEGAMMQSKEVIKELYDALIAQGLSPQEAMEKIKEIIASSQSEGPQSPMMGEEFPGQEFGRAPAAFGGIMDTYTGRRKYSRGQLVQPGPGRPGYGGFPNPFKVVKKALKKVKKLASSKLGKLALMYAAGTYLGGTQALGGTGQLSFAQRLRDPKLLANLINPTGSGVGEGKGWSMFQKAAPQTTGKGIIDWSGVDKIKAQEADFLKNIAFEGSVKDVLPKAAGTDWKTAAKWIVPTSLLAGATAEETDEVGGVEKDYNEDLARWGEKLAPYKGKYRVDPQFLLPGAAEGGRIGRQEGGLMDLGGMEKDYRNDGGFVPLGGEEKADDVPARLSRNEFVFTADAVRNAGGGDIDAGAEVMENVMKNLEGGGKISEESQGQGAQEMFETSERLSEVI